MIVDKPQGNYKGICGHNLCQRGFQRGRRLHIFIDESAGFQRNQAKPHSISCVGAAIIPGRNLGELERGFQILLKEWPRTEAGEIKGRLLHEHHVVALCNLLMQLDFIFEASVMDMNVSDDADIDYHKSMQAKGMTINLTRDHDPDFVRNVWELRRLLEKMSRQLYTQAVALADVVWSAFQDGQLYFCQRLPGELARFHWVIDAKDKKRITDYEEWWRQCIMPLIQSRSSQKTARIA